ncbi:MAG: hypothetical protein CME70_03485 [Halobacteriovorax sp.]|nr:hypothetical protein [Halobacteriovorax sp.]|tara:strand:+ start:223812 stop:225383 length:1572 start_codon:yes stop_codon:yes gene_type:complete
MKFIFLFFFLFSLNSYSQFEESSVDELIESEEYEKATEVLKEKIKEGPVNLQDILLLGRIYEGLEQNKSAIKVYLFGIRKLHSSSWKNIKSNSDLKEVLPELKKPKKEALLLAYKVAVLYYDLFLVSEASDDFNRRILDTSLKYFLICDHFEFNMPKTQYFLGLIYKEYEDYRRSSLAFYDAWKRFEKIEKVDTERDQKLKLLLGESLINYGHITNGTAYLRDIYFKKNGSRYLRDYASEYLDEFLGTSVGGSLSFLVGNDSNAILGNSTGFETIKGSAYNSKAASIYLSHSPSYSSSYNFSLSYSEEMYTEDTLKDNDSRSLVFTSNWDYKKIEKTILGLSYYLTKSYARADVNSKFSPESDSHQFIFGWTRIFRKSTFSLSLPLQRTFYESGGSTDSKGLAIAYSPITFSDYWNPSINFDFNLQEEDQGFDDSKSFILSFSNSMNFSSSIGVSLDFSLENNSNTSESLAYTERVLELGLFYSFEKIEGLSLDLSISSEANKPKAGTADSRLKTGLGLSYIL